MKVEGRGHPYRWGTYYVCEVSSQHASRRRRLHAVVQMIMGGNENERRNKTGLKYETIYLSNTLNKGIKTVDRNIVSF